jgi:hypothetical protein
MQEGLSAEFKLVFKVETERRLKRGWDFGLSRGGEEEFWSQFCAQAIEKTDDLRQITKNTSKLHVTIREKFGDELRKQIVKTTTFNVREDAKEAAKTAWQQVSRKLREMDKELKVSQKTEKAEPLRKEAESLANAFKDEPKQDELPRRRKQVDALSTAE